MPFGTLCHLEHYATWDIGVLCHYVIGQNVLNCPELSYFVLFYPVLFSDIKAHQGGQGSRLATPDPSNLVGGDVVGMESGKFPTPSHFYYPGNFKNNISLKFGKSCEN
jgi:hypothetical protein